MKRSSRRLAWVAAALVVLALGAGIALKLTLTPERLRGEIERRAAAATGLPVEVGGADLSLLPFGVQIRELRVGTDAAPFVELGKGLVRLDLAPLLSRRIVVSRITLESPQVTLVRGPEGLLLPGRLGSAPGGDEGDAPGAGTPGGGAAEAGAAAFTTTVEWIEVRDGALRIRTPEGTEEVALDGIGLGARVEILAGGEGVNTAGELQLSGLSLAALDAWRDTLDRLDPVVAFDLEIRPRQGRVELREVRLRADPLDVAGRGTLEGLPESPVLRLEVDPRTYELSELLPLIPAALIPEGRTPTASGPVRIAASVEGPLGAEMPPAWRTEIGFEGAALAMEGFPVGLQGLQGTVRASAEEIEIDGLRATLGDDPLEVSGRIEGLGTPAARVDLTVRGDVDLALLERGGFVPAGVAVGGRASLDVRAVGRLDDPQAAQLEGRARLAGGRVTTPDLPVPVTDLTLDIRLDRADIEIAAVEGRLGSSAFEGSGRIANALGEPDLEFTGRCSRLDLVELAPPPDDGKGAAAQAAAGPGTVAAPPPPLVPPLPPFPARLELAVDSLLTVGMVLSGVDLSADLRPTGGKVKARIARAETEAVSLDRFDTTFDLAAGGATGDFRAPVVQAHVVPMTDVTGRFELGADRQLRVSGVRGAAWMGTVQGNATVDLTVPTDPGFTIESEAVGIQANDFVSSFTPAASNLLFGSLDLRSSFSGRGATAADVVAGLTGEGAVTTTNGRIESTPAIQRTWATLGLSDRENIPFADLIAPFSLREGKVFTDSLAIVGRDADWMIRGFVGLDGRLDYRVTAELSGAVSDEMRRRAGSDLVNLLAGSAGRLVVDLHVHGDARQPKVDLDRAKLAERARENARRKAQEELDKLKNEGAQKVGDALKGLFQKD